MMYIIPDLTTPSSQLSYNSLILPIKARILSRCVRATAVSCGFLTCISALSVLRAVCRMCAAWKLIPFCSRSCKMFCGSKNVCGAAVASNGSAVFLCLKMIIFSFFNNVKFYG